MAAGPACSVGKEVRGGGVQGGEGQGIDDGVGVHGVKVAVFDGFGIECKNSPYAFGKIEKHKAVGNVFPKVNEFVYELFVFR